MGQKTVRVMDRQRLVFFDFVTDEIRSRALQVFGVLFVVQLVFFLVGSKVLVDPRSSAASTVTSVQLFQLPGGAQIGTSLRSQPLVRVLHQSVPVEDCVVELRVASIRTELLRETLICQQADYTSFAEHSAAREAVCAAAFRGQNAAVVSNLCGVSSFNVSIGAGIVALYELEFVARDRLPDADDDDDEDETPTEHQGRDDSALPRVTAFVRTTSSISSFAVSSTLPKEVRTQVPQGSVRVDVTGGAAGATVFLICDSIGMDAWPRPAYYETQDSPLPCVLSPSTAQVGADGAARFENVVVNGSLGEYFQILVVAEWLSVPLLPQPPALGSLFRVATEVAEVALVAVNVTSVREMQVFEPRVAVRDARGRPVVGRLVFAQVFYEVNSETFADRIFWRKELVDAVSLPTDASGQAVWTSLRFSAGGPAGAYSVRFRCDGVSSALANFTVQSLVQQLLVGSPAPKLPENRSLTQLLLAQETVVTINVLDANGGPVKVRKMRRLLRACCLTFGAGQAGGHSERVRPHRDCLCDQSAEQRTGRAAVYRGRLQGRLCARRCVCVGRADCQGGQRDCALARRSLQGPRRPRRVL